MASISVRGKISLNNTDKLEKDIARQLKDRLNSKLNRNLRKIQHELQLVVQRALLTSPEVVSLASGKLQAEFGIRDGADAIGSIIDWWVGRIIVSRSPIRVVGSGLLKSTLKVSMIQADYADVLSLPLASIVTDKGVTLPWLEWLLKFGDKYIIRDYEIKYNAQSNRVAKSRSGDAIMVKSNKKSWRVPPEFAGTQNNNFVTRALDSIDDQIQEILELIFS